MPLYEYACHQCDREFELLIRGQETPHCPECGDDHLEKLLSVPATPSGSVRDLPLAPSSHAGGGCGLPQCGAGRCQGGM